VTTAVGSDADIPMLFHRMQSLLKAMHDENPSWGPLFVRHPGNLYRHPHYVPARTSTARMALDTDLEAEAVALKRSELHLPGFTLTAARREP